MKNKRETNLVRTLNEQFIKGQIKGYNEGHTRGMLFAVQKYSSVILICLKDKFDFTPEQLQVVAAHANNYFDSICNGDVTFNDIAETLLEEDNLQISFDGTVVEGKERLSE